MIVLVVVSTQYAGDLASAAAAAFTTNHCSQLEREQTDRASANSRETAECEEQLGSSDSLVGEPGRGSGWGSRL